MYVKDWMTKNPVCLSPDDNIIDVYNAMNEGNFRRVPVVEKGKLVGLITEDTLSDYTPSKATSLSIHEINSLFQRTLCKEIMNKDVITISPDALLEEAADAMMVNNVTCLPVVNGDTDMLVGIITQKTIFGAFVDLMGYYANGSRIVVEVEDDKPGVLENISDILAKANVSISHLAVYHYDKISIVIRVDDKDPIKIKNLLESNGYKVTDYRINKN